MQRVPRIAVYLPNLNGGGAERLHVNLAGFFLDQGVRVTMLLDRAEGPLLPSLPAGVEVVDLGASRQLLALPKLARYLVRAAPDVLVANMVHNNILALWAKALVPTRTKLVISVHNSLADDCRRPQLKYRMMPPFYRVFGGWADGVVAVSQGIADELVRISRIDAGRIKVLYNGVVTAEFERKAREPVTHRWFGADHAVFVAVGRLYLQKDYPTLVRAFALVAKQRPAKLLILGEGEDRPQLEALAAKLGIAEHVELPGFCANPLPLMREASAVVLSSQFEGFGNVVAEALALGTSVVSTDCAHGPREILANGRFGLLTPVGEPAPMAAAMLRILDQPFDPAVLRERGRVFSIQQCGAEYLDFFRALLEPNAGRAQGVGGRARLSAGNRQ